MGIVADATLAAGGSVVGIIPEHIQVLEVEHTGLTELLVVDSMHTRKRMMVDRSDAFVVLPGGLGTLDETFEILTWKQLRLHDKPIVVANVDPHSVRETTVHLDLTKLGLRPGESFEVHDLISGETWTWSDHNFVRLDAFVEPAHVIHVRRSAA